MHLPRHMGLPPLRIIHGSRRRCLWDRLQLLWRLLLAWLRARCCLLQRLLPADLLKSSLLLLLRRRLLLLGGLSGALPPLWRHAVLLHRWQLCAVAQQRPRGSAAC